MSEKTKPPVFTLGVIEGEALNAEPSAQLAFAGGLADAADELTRVVEVQVGDVVRGVDLAQRVAELPRLAVDRDQIGRLTGGVDDHDHPGLGDDHRRLGGGTTNHELTTGVGHETPRKQS